MELKTSDSFGDKCNKSVVVVKKKKKHNNLCYTVIKKKLITCLYRAIEIKHVYRLCHC